MKVKKHLNEKRIKKREKRHFAFLIILAILLINCFPQEKNNDKANSQNDVFSEVDSLLLKIEFLESKIKELETSETIWYHEDYYGMKLVEEGISSPIRFIDSSFRADATIIPLKAILGGTMRIGNTKLIGDKWILANYDDVHIYGLALFEYTFSKEKKLQFKLLKSCQPQ